LPPALTRLARCSKRKECPPWPKILQRNHPLQWRAAPKRLENQIRQRAYELYEERGREDGRDLDDWLRAEEEITGTKVRTVAA